MSFYCFDRSYIMPPCVRGKGKGPMKGGPSSHAGPSHRCMPPASFTSSNSRDNWRHSFKPARLVWFFTIFSPLIWAAYSR
ncbi:hypothetical protein Hanom_Chr17g01576811 [Helianthus anomalus]